MAGVYRYPIWELQVQGEHTLDARKALEGLMTEQQTAIKKLLKQLKRDKVKFEDKFVTLHDQRNAYSGCGRIVATSAREVTFA